MKTKEYLELELRNILYIHFSAKYFFRDVKYLNNPETGKECIAATDYPLIKRIRIAFWRLGIIEIAKLFQKSKNQQYNLIQFIESLVKDYESYEWLNVIDKAKLIKWHSILISDKIEDLRNRINIQRNQYFAHSDKHPNEELNKVQLSFADIDRLLEITETIISELKLKCFRTHVDMEITGMEKAGYILDAFAALTEKRDSDNKREMDEFDEEN